MQWFWLSKDTWVVLFSPLSCAGVCHPHASKPQFSLCGHCASLPLCLHLIHKPHKLSLCDLDSCVPHGTINAPPPAERSHSCCAVTYLCSHQSLLHCRRRTPPHPARSRLHRYPHPQSDNPRDTEGWADQANTQWLLDQTSSSLGSKRGRRALGGRSHNQVFMSHYSLVRGFIQSDPKSSRHKKDSAVNFSRTQLHETIRKYMSLVCRVLVLQFSILVSFALFCIK